MMEGNNLCIMDERKNKFLTNDAVVCLLAVISCALWGSAFPGIKTGYKLFNIAAGDTSTQILFAGCRFFLAGILAISIGSAAKKNLLKPRKTSWKMIFKLSLFQTVLQAMLFYIGLAHTSGVKSSIIDGSGVFITILIASLVFKMEKLTLKKIIGCILGFAGVVVMNTGGPGFTAGINFFGDGFIFLSTIAYAVSSVMIKDYSKYDNPVMLSGYQFICGGFIMIVCGLLSGGRILHVTVSGVAILVYLAFLSAVAYSIWGLLLKYNPVSKVAVWGFTDPIFGVIFSLIFLNEGNQNSFQRTIAALFFVCLGIYIVNSAKSFTRLRLSRKSS